MPVSDQTPAVTLEPRSVSAVCAALNAGVTLDVGSMLSVGLILDAAAFDGTIFVEYSVDDGVTYLAAGTSVGCQRGAALPPVGFPEVYAVVTAVRAGTLLLPGGVTHVHVYISAYVAGSITITLAASGNLTPPNYVLQLPTALVGGRFDTNIGAWLGATTPTVGQKTMAASLPVAIASDQTQVPVVGPVAHDSPDTPTNPVKIGAKAESSIAGSTPVADGDITDLYADVDGVQITKSMCPYGDIITDTVSNTDGASTAFPNFGATAGARNMITTIACMNTSNTTAYIEFRDGVAGAVFWRIPLPRDGGSVINLPVPLRQPTANTALAFDVSAALNTVYISLVGFKSKV